MNELISNVINCERVKDMSKLRREVFVVLYLCDGKFKGNSDYDCIGTKDSVPFPDTDIIIKNCGRLATNTILLIHNHPYHWGLETLFTKEYNPEASIWDISSTKLFTEIVSQHGIQVLDHIIVTGNGDYFSFVESNLM